MVEPIWNQYHTLAANMEYKIPVQITRFAQETVLSQKCSHVPYYEDSYWPMGTVGTDIAEKNGLMTGGSEEEMTMNTCERGTFVLGGQEKRGTESVGYEEGTGTRVATGRESAGEGAIEKKSIEEEGYREEEEGGGKSAVEKREEEEEKGDEESDGKRAVEKREEEKGKEEKMGDGLFPEGGEIPKAFEVERKGEEGEGELAQKKTPPKRKRRRRHRRRAKPEHSAEKNSDTPRGAITKVLSLRQTSMTQTIIRAILIFSLVATATELPTKSNGTAGHGISTCIACKDPGCIAKLTAIWCGHTEIWNKKMKIPNCTQLEPSVPCQHDDRVFMLVDEVHLPRIHHCDMEGVNGDRAECPSVNVPAQYANLSSPPTPPPITTGTNGRHYWIPIAFVIVVIAGVTAIFCLKRRKQDNGDGVNMGDLRNLNLDTVNTEREGIAVVIPDGEAAADEMTTSNFLLHEVVERG